MAAVGYGKTQKKVIALVQNFVDEKDMNKSVSNGWWECLTCRSAKIPLSMARAKATDLDMLIG